jgi:hypothetical protein
MKQVNTIYINGKFETPHGSELLTHEIPPFTASVGLYRSTFSRPQRRSAGDVNGG